MTHGFVKSVTGFAAALIVLMLAVTANAVTPVQTSPPQLPDAPGKAVVERVCLTCHGAEVILPERSVPAWRDTLELMKGFGAVATDEEWKTIYTYILSNVAYLNVNRGTAEDFAAVFLIDAAAAGGIVAHRENAGGFKTIDDLKKAPGLDAARVDAAKDRLSF